MTLKKLPITKKHWTQQPKNKARLKKQLKKMQLAANKLRKLKDAKSE